MKFINLCLFCTALMMHGLHVHVPFEPLAFKCHSLCTSQKQGEKNTVVWEKLQNSICLSEEPKTVISRSISPLILFHMIFY